MLKVIYYLSVLIAVGGFQGVSDPDQEVLDKVVAIHVREVPKCLGAFVTGDPASTTTNAEFIVTAAHCIYGVPVSELKVELGKTKSEEVKKVKRVMVHPYYMPPSPDYDIALLKISTGSSARSGWPLIKVVPSSGLKAVHWNFKESNSTLPVATLEDRKSCQEKMANHIVVSTRMLCANTASGSVTDGSPLIQEKGIVGVGSYNVGGKGPKIFTNIANSEIYSFIERYVD